MLHIHCCSSIRSCVIVHSNDRTLSQHIKIRARLPMSFWCLRAENAFSLITNKCLLLHCLPLERLGKKTCSWTLKKLWSCSSEGLNRFCAFRWFISLLSLARGIFYTCLHGSQFFIPLFGLAQISPKKREKIKPNELCPLSFGFSLSLIKVDTLFQVLPFE